MAYSRGRARQADSSFVILSEQSGRSANMLVLSGLIQHTLGLISYFLLVAFPADLAGRSANVLAQAEQTQLAIAHNFKPTDAETDKHSLTIAQQSRERGAKKGLTGAINEENSVAKLNVFCKQTKVL